MGKTMYRAEGGVKAPHKPHFKSRSGTRKFELPSLNTLPFGALLLLLITLAVAINWVQDDGIGFSHHLSPFVDWDHRRDAVRNAFIASWDAYSQHAWGKSDRFP